MRHLTPKELVCSGYQLTMMNISNKSRSVSKVTTLFVAQMLFYIRALVAETISSPFYIFCFSFQLSKCRSWTIILIPTFAKPSTKNKNYLKSQNNFALKWVAHIWYLLQKLFMLWSSKRSLIMPNWDFCLLKSCWMLAWLQTSSSTGTMDLFKEEFLTASSLRKVIT